MFSDHSGKKEKRRRYADAGLENDESPALKRELCGSESAIGCANLYKMEYGGGARPDWKLAGWFEVEAVHSSLLSGTAKDWCSLQAGLTCAHWETVTARQQS